MTEHGGFQAAFAYLLVSDEARRGLTGDAAELQRRYALTDDEVAALRNLDAERLELTSRMTRNKRAGLIQRGMPATLAALGTPAHRHLLLEFLAHAPGGEDEWDTHRVVAEGRSLADFLRGAAKASGGGVHAPRWLAELAHLEWQKLDLSANAAAWAGLEAAERRAAEGAQWVAAGLPARHGLRLVVGAHVRILAFEHDVLAAAEELDRTDRRPGEPLPEPAARQTLVTLVRRRARPPVVAYRTGEEAAAGLKLCLTAAAACDVLGRSRDPRWASWLAGAVENGIVLCVREGENEDPRVIASARERARAPEDCGKEA